MSGVWVRVWELVPDPRGDGATGVSHCRVSSGPPSWPVVRAPSARAASAPAPLVLRESPTAALMPLRDMPVHVCNLVG